MISAHRSARAPSSSFVSFAIGAAHPAAARSSWALMGQRGDLRRRRRSPRCALFAIGIVLSLFTGHGALRGGLRMVLIGGGAGRRGLGAWASCWARASMMTH